MREDGLNFYKCIQAPWYQLSDSVIKRLTPYEPERKNGHWLRYGEDGYPNNEDTVKGAVIHLAGQLRAVGDKFDIVRVEDDA